MGCIWSKARKQNRSGQWLFNTLRGDDIGIELDSSVHHHADAAGSDLECILPSNALRRALQLQQKQIAITFEEKPDPEPEPEVMLTYLYMNWKDLQHDSSIVEALKQTRFVTSADGNLCRPKDLFDPGDVLLTLLFSGEAHMFPGERFASDGWLKILRDTGIQNACNAVTMLQCARRIEFLGAESMKHVDANTVSLEIWYLAETLINAIFENCALLHDHSFCNLFGNIACVPAEKGFPFETGKKRVNRVLCSYSDAVLMKDWRLAWAAAPILSKESLVPPDYCWEALKLQSPPPFTTVLKHLQANWWSTKTALFTVEGASLEVLKYLDKIWGTLSTSDILELQQLAFLAADNGTRLAAPGSIFVHLILNLSPLASKLPSCYIPFMNILKELGVKDKLSVSCAVNILSNYYKSCGYYRLNPNEHHAVIELLQFLCDETTEQQMISYKPNWQLELVVPDDGCRLVRPNTCVYIDPCGSQYLKYINSSKIKFVHRDVSERLCLAFGIRKLSDVVVEKLDHVEHLESSEEAGPGSLAAIRVKLLSRSFQVAVSSVATNFSSFTPGFKCPDFPTLQKLLKSISKRLKLVQHIYTRFWLLSKSLDITRASNESIIQQSKSRSCHRALYYVDRAKTCMLIAKRPDYVSVPDLVAIVVSHVLGSPFPLPIGSLFLCPKDSEPTLVNVMNLSSNERLIEGAGCGNSFLGTHLLPRDENKLRLNSACARPFDQGQIVAWRYEDGEKLRYGRILNKVRPLPGRMLYCLKIETFPGKTETILSLHVFPFKFFTVEEESSSSTLGMPVDSDNLVSSNGHVQQPLSQDGRVPGDEFIKSVEDILSAAGMNIDTEKQRLLQKTLSLQEGLDESQAALVLEQEQSKKARKEGEATLQCRICLSSERDVILVPCGHVLCNTCASHVTRCPICKVRISKTMKLYRS